MSVALSTIYANILKDLGLNSESTGWQGRATRWVNKALDKIEAKNPDAEFLQNSNSTIATVADQATYSMPSDFLILRHIRDDDNSNHLNILSHEEFDRKHPDPSSETTDAPADCTLEFDISSGVHILRLAPIPDAAYNLYATFSTFHPALSGAQNLMWNKLETAIEDWAIWEGSLVTFIDAEFTNYRNELKQRANESVLLVSGLLAAQRPHPSNIPVRLKRNVYHA